MSDTAQNALTAKRVGQYLIDAGVLKREELEEALDRQKRMSRAGFHVLLGTILEEMGAIDRQSLEAIILRQRLDEGSVSLGPDADWSSMRSPSDISVTDQEYTNGTTETAELTGNVAPEPTGLVVSETDAIVEEAGLSLAEEVIPELTAAPILTDEPQDREMAGTLEPETVGTPLESEPVAEVTADEEDLSDTSEMAAVDVTEPSQGFNEPVVNGPVVAGRIETPDLSATHSEGSAPVESTELASEKEGNEMYAPTTEPAGEAGSTWGTTETTTAADRVEVQGFSFTRAAQGLQESEVAAALGQMVKRAQALEEQMNEAKESLAHIDSLRRYGEQTVKAADTIAEQIQAEAEKQAAAIRDRAQEEARRIIADAKVRCEDMLRAAGERAGSVAEEIRRNIAEHTEVNNRLLEMAEQLLNAEAQE